MIKRISISDGEGYDWSYDTFEVIRRDNGAVVFHPKKIADRIPNAVGGDGRASIRFDYWLPDSKHITFSTTDGCTSGSTFHHHTMNIYTGKLLPFTGWLAPNGKIAVVPEREYDPRDYIGYGIDNGPGAVTVISEGKWYVAQLPKGFVSFRFKTASKKLIEGPRALVVEPDLNNEWGKRRVVKSSYTWFPLTTYMFAGFAGGGRDEESSAKVAHPPVVEFSKGSRWAIGNGSMGCYIISMTTGKVRKLSGIQAHFVD